jgi:hypothetical protein
VKKKEKAPASGAKLNFKRFYCQEILVHYWLSVFGPAFCGGHLFSVFLFLENIEIERTIPQNIMIVMITAGKSRG